MGAPAARVSELSRAWAARAHKVTVLAAFPHHPTGVIPGKYRGRLLMRERDRGVEVLRTWVYPAPNRGFLRRTLSYLSFMCSSLAIGLPALSGRRFDAVIATSPQFFVAVAGFLLASALRCPFIFEVRDIWPASIEAVGAVRNRRLIALLEKVEMALYGRARLVVAVSDSAGTTLARRGVPGAKIAVVKNGVDLEMFRPAPRENAVRASLGLASKFVVSYVGTIGMAHGLEIVLEAARLTESDRGLVYLVVGEGARRAELEAAAKERGLSNVVFAGEVPRERVPEYLAASDALLVHLRRAPLFEGVIPSKIFEIMACARPIILGVRGEAASIIRDARAGIEIEPESAAEFVAAIARLRSDASLALEMGRSGRAFVEAHFDRRRLADDYLSLLSALLRP